MRRFRNFLLGQLDNLDRELEFYEQYKKEEEASGVDKQIHDMEKELKILTSIEQEGEGNLIRFNNNGTFHCWCFRTPEGGAQIIEEYNDISLDDAEYGFECSSCRDVTDSFLLENILCSVRVSEHIPENPDTELYYFVSNDTFVNEVIYAEKDA